jgi:hypothetical protein
VGSLPEVVVAVGPARITLGQPIEHVARWLAIAQRAVQATGVVRDRHQASCGGQVTGAGERADVSGISLVPLHLDSRMYLVPSYILTASLIT